MSIVVHWSAAERPMFAVDPCGDVHTIVPIDGGEVVAVIDGGGHGAEALSAAAAIVEEVRRAASRDVVETVTRCHTAMRGTRRGAAIAIAFIDHVAATMTWCSAGNVAGARFRPHEDEASSVPRAALLTRRQGSLGIHLPELEAVTLDIRAGDVIALATDGIERRFEEEAFDGANDPAMIAAALLAHYRKNGDDALVCIGCVGRR